MTEDQLTHLKQFLDCLPESANFDGISISADIDVTSENIAVLNKLLDRDVICCRDNIKINNRYSFSLENNYLPVNSNIAVSYQDYYNKILTAAVDAPEITTLEAIFNEKHNRESQTILNKIKCFARLIKVLKDFFYYRYDLIIIFGSNIIEIEPPSNTTDTINAINSLTDDDIKTIDSFTTWFLQEDVESSKRREIAANILSTELKDISKSDRIWRFKSKALFEECRKSYMLYLEEFSYTKFVKKLEEHALGFYSKVSDSLNTVTVQVLSLPVFLSFMKYNNLSTDGLAVFLFFLYIIIVLFFLFQKSRYLNNLEEEFLSFNNKYQNISGLGEDIPAIRKRFDSQMKLQKGALLLLGLVSVILLVISLILYLNNIICAT